MVCTDHACVVTEEPGKTHDHLLGMLIAQSINDPDGFTRQEVLDEAIMFYLVSKAVTLIEGLQYLRHHCITYRLGWKVL